MPSQQPGNTPGCLPAPSTCSEGIGKDVNEAASGLTHSQQLILETDAVGLDPWLCPYWLSEPQHFRVQDGRTLSWICEYVSMQMCSAGCNGVGAIPQPSSFSQVCSMSRCVKFSLWPTLRRFWIDRSNVELVGFSVLDSK